MASKDIKYINKDFDSFKQTLIDFAKSYFPNTYNDFNDADPGNMFIELAAYVGDVLSFYQDTQFAETNPLLAKEKENLLSLAYTRGYRPKVTNAALVDLEIYQLLPSYYTGTEYLPDYSYALIVNNNTIVTSISTGQTFLTQDIVNFNFSSQYNPTEITVYQVDSNGNPVYYLLKKKVKAISGTIKTQTYNFGSPERFPTITITDNNIIGVLDIIDSDNNKWYEVPYLAQETIFDEVLNTDSLRDEFNDYSEVPYLLKLKKVPRRFVTRFRADDLMEIKFGSGISSNADEVIIPNPNNVGMGLSDGISKLNMAFDPSNFLYTQTYGLAPSNTTLTVRYLSGGGIAANVPSNDINIIDSSNSFFTNSELDDTLSNTILSSLSVNNPFPAIGGKGGDSIDDLRNNTIAAFGTQLRAVTKEDYLVRALSLPSRYGSIAKAYILQDSQFSTNSGNDMLIDNNPLSLSLYVLTYNSNKNLTIGSNTFKNNLAIYLSQFRMLNDSINIKNAYVVNIGINFDVVIFPGYNNKEIILNCINVLKDHFNIDKWQINQPIIISEINNKLSQVQGVQSVSKIEIINKTSEGGFEEGGSYSQYAYDIVGATRNGIIYPSLDPCIFECRYPDIDIMGRSVSF